MKRKLVLLIAIVMVMAMMPINTFANTPVKVTVNGHELDFDVDPRIIEGRTLVPVRDIFEALGVLVEWDGVNKTVIATKDSTEIQLPIDNLTAKKDGEDITLDVPAKIIDGRTLVPVRFISESLGCEVNWDKDTKTVSIVGQQEKLTVSDISKKSNAVVKIDTYRDGELWGNGSGFIISKDGKLVTNYHVIDRATDVEIIMDDNETIYTDVKVLQYDVDKDLALLKIDTENLPFLDLGNSSWVEKGDEVVAIGSPYGLLNTVTTGMVSNVLDEGFQTTAGTHPGSSGGALFDMYGRVIGVTYMVVREAEDINFAIPINELEKLNEEYDISLAELVKMEYPSSVFPPSVVLGKSYKSTEIELAWEHMPDATYYNLYYSESEDGPFEKVKVGKGDIEIYENYYAVCTFVDLDADTTYYIKISSVVDGNESKCSDLLVVKTIDEIEEANSKGWFEDEELEYAVRTELGRQYDDNAITQSELESITELDLYSCYIEDLEGIQYLTNLEWLDLSYNYIEDWTPLKKLKNLKTLDLTSNDFQDLSVLSGLNKLEYLYLSENEIQNLAPISGLTNLKDLYLGMNNIKDFSQLKRLTELEVLDLYDNKITDIKPVQYCTNLVELDLGANLIEDISSISKLEKMEFLYLDDNEISDIKPLETLINLDYLNLEVNSIVDISPIKNLKKLTSIDLSSNKILDASIFVNMGNIENIELDENPIEDYEVLQSLVEEGILYY